MANVLLNERIREITLFLIAIVDNVRTVSDTKRDFYTFHTRPINSIYRRVVEELMVEMHLLSVNVNFRYDAIYALGVVTVFERFMQGYRPEQDKGSIFNALCQSIGSDPSQYHQSAEQICAEVDQLESMEQWQANVQKLPDSDGSGLMNQLQAIAQNENFKYSRLFAIGLYTLIERVDSDLAENEKRFDEAMKPLCEALKILPDKLNKDLELYRSNLDKMLQAQEVMADILEADRKKQEERRKAQAEKDAEQDKDAIATPSDSADEANPS